MAELAIREFDYLDPENDMSLFCKMTPKVQEALSGLPASLLEKDEIELAEDIKPNATINCLRFRLWEEYNKSRDSDQRINLTSLVNGLCTPNYFYAAVLRNQKVLAYLLIPPKKYEDAALEALLLGVTQLRKILEFPLWDKKGLPNTKVANLQLSVVKMLDARLKGAPTQTINQKTLQVTASADNAIQNLIDGGSMEEIEKRLRKLRGEEEKEVLLDQRRPKIEEFKSKEIELEVAKPLDAGKKNEY